MQVLFIKIILILQLSSMDEAKYNKELYNIKTELLKIQEFT